MKQHRYTKEQIEYIKKIAPVCTCDEIVSKFNKKYNLNQSKQSLKGIRYRHGIEVGDKNRPTKFKKNHIPWNKGLKGIQTGGSKGWFGKGDKHNKYKPIGTETVDSRGYTLIKTGDPDIWERKHYSIWEKHNGKVPENHLVIFADRDKQNFNIGNLILVTRGQLTRLHKNKLIQDDTELTKTMLNVVKLYESIDSKEE